MMNIPKSSGIAWWVPLSSVSIPAGRVLVGVMCLLGVLLSASCSQGGGGVDDESGTSGDPPDNAPLSFSDPADSTASITGMREFLLTVTASNKITNRTEFAFAVSDKATPPAWNSIANRAVVIRRIFDNTGDLQSREIYFSATWELEWISFDASSDRVGTVDLASKPADTTELAYTRAQVPGMMVPGQSYYVHVWQGGTHVTTSEAVRLLDYPRRDELPVQMSNASDSTFDNSTNALFPDFSAANYSFLMRMWLEQDGSAFHTLETRAGEATFLPVRMITLTNLASQPASFAFTGCSQAGGTVRFQWSVPGGSKTTGVSINTNNAISQNTFDMTMQAGNHPDINARSDMADGMLRRGGGGISGDRIAAHMYTLGCLPKGADIIENGIDWPIDIIEE